MKSQIEILIEKVNEDHYQNDYKRSVLSDTTLRRNLAERAKAAGLDTSKLAMGEYGPCGSFAYRVANSPAKEVTITEAEHAALVAVAEAADFTAEATYNDGGNGIAELRVALANLAAVRAGSEVGK